MTAKNNKLKCIVTGRKLIATKEYYARKVEKAGGAEELHRSYICREAKNLIKQGTSINKIRDILGTESDELGDVDQDIINSILTCDKRNNLLRVNNLVSINKLLSTETDPDVKKYINNIVKSEKRRNV
jgi:hypothetical protein